MVGRRPGIPIGPTRCGRCGAEGVNRRTCTGDADTHVLLAKEHRTTLGSGNQPSYNTEDGKQPAKEWGEWAQPDTAKLHEEQDEVDEVVDLFTGDIVLTLPEREPRDAVLHQLTLKVVTKYPLGTEALLLASLESNSAIWIGTTFEEVVLNA